MQVRLLPDARPQVTGKAPLGTAKVGAMYDAATRSIDGGRMDLVQHLVEHDHLHEIARHPRVVERRVDPDHLLVVEVHAHLDRALAAARAAPAPADARADRAVEMARVQTGVDLRQVVYAPARRERRLRPRRERPDELPVLANVLVDGAAVSAPVATRETGERPHHRLVGPREHVMEPETQTTLHAPVADHGPGVVG